MDKVFTDSMYTLINLGHMDQIYTMANICLTKYVAVYIPCSLNFHVINFL